MGQTSLYLLKEKNRPAVKIGISNDVERRGAELFEDIDWENSCYVTFPNRRLAKKTEGFLHAHLAAFSTPKKHKLPGWTEWFRADAYYKATAFLKREKEAGLICCSDLNFLLKTENALHINEDVQPYMDLLNDLYCLRGDEIFVKKFHGSIIVRGRHFSDGELSIRPDLTLNWSSEDKGDYCILTFLLIYFDPSTGLSKKATTYERPLKYFDLLYHGNDPLIPSLMSRQNQFCESLEILSPADIGVDCFMEISNACSFSIPDYGYIGVQHLIL